MQLQQPVNQSLKALLDDLQGVVNGTPNIALRAIALMVVPKNLC